MVYREEKQDLFTVDESYALAHCISADFALGAGIAVEFNQRFNMKKKLYEKRPDCWKYMQSQNISGMCIVVDNVLNLVTKERYWHKPTYDSLECSLKSMRAACRHYEIHKVAMPTIGCGLDKLQWEKVSKLIREVFEFDDIEILVCIK